MGPAREWESELAQVLVATLEEGIIWNSYEWRDLHAMVADRDPQDCLC